MVSNNYLENRGSWEKLVKEGFGGSLSVQPFSTEHGDLIIETTINTEMKLLGGPMQGGYNTILPAFNKFQKSNHLLAKLGAATKKKLRVRTSSHHKEWTIISMV